MITKYNKFSRRKKTSVRYAIITRSQDEAIRSPQGIKREAAVLNENFKHLRSSIIHKWLDIF